VNEGVEFGGAGGDVCGAGIGEVEEGVVAGAEEGENGLLAEGFWFVGLLVFRVECTAECPRCCGRGENEVTGLVWAGKAV